VAQALVCPKYQQVLMFGNCKNKSEALAKSNIALPHFNTCVVYILLLGSWGVVGVKRRFW